jgi:hypothetical protein
VTTEDKFVIVMAVASVLLLIVGVGVAKVLSTAPPKVMRAFWPVAAALTGAFYATIVFVARANVKG